MTDKNAVRSSLPNYTSMKDEEAMDRVMDCLEVNDQGDAQVAS